MPPFKFLIKVLIIEDKVGRRIFPSVVAYKDSGGDYAKFHIVRDTSSSFLFYCLKIFPCSSHSFIRSASSSASL